MMYYMLSVENCIVPSVWTNMNHFGMWWVKIHISRRDSAKRAQPSGGHVLNLYCEHFTGSVISNIYVNTDRETLHQFQSFM